MSTIDSWKLRYVLWLHNPCRQRRALWESYRIHVRMWGEEGCFKLVSTLKPTLLQSSVDSYWSYVYLPDCFFVKSWRIERLQCFGPNRAFTGYCCAQLVCYVQKTFEKVMVLGKIMLGKEWLKDRNHFVSIIVQEHWIPRHFGLSKAAKTTIDEYLIGWVKTKISRC